MSDSSWRQKAARILERQPGLIFALQSSTTEILQQAYQEYHGVPAPTVKTCPQTLSEKAVVKTLHTASVSCHISNNIVWMRDICVSTGNTGRKLLVLDNWGSPGMTRVLVWSSLSFHLLGRTLGRRNHQVIPSSCVIRIRKSFPDPHKLLLWSLPKTDATSPSFKTKCVPYYMS